VERRKLPPRTRTGWTDQRPLERTTLYESPRDLLYKTFWNVHKKQIVGGLQLRLDTRDQLTSNTCDAKLAESAETMRRWSANALVHRWGVAESLRKGPQFPRIKRGAKKARERFWMTLCLHLAQARADRKKNIFARVKILGEQTQLPLSSRPSHVNHFSFLVTTYIRCRLPTMQKKIFDWTRCYTEHQSTLWWANTLAMLAQALQHVSANEKCKWRYVKRWRYYAMGLTMMVQKEPRLTR